MSKRIDEAISVCETAKQSILDSLSQTEDSLDETEIKALLQSSVKEVARQYDVETSTVWSKITRELGGLTVREFYKLLVSHLTGDEKRHSKLTALLRKHSCRDDNIQDIRNRMEAI